MAAGKASAHRMRHARDRQASEMSLIRFFRKKWPIGFLESRKRMDRCYCWLDTRRCCDLVNCAKHEWRGGKLMVDTVNLQFFPFCAGTTAVAREKKNADNNQQLGVAGVSADKTAVLKQ